MSSKFGYFLGGAAIGAVGLGIASYLIDKYGKSSTEDLCIGCGSEPCEEPQTESVSEHRCAPVEEAL